MPCFSRSLIIFGFLLCHYARTSATTLSAQCWHEFPLSTVNVQSSHDGLEFIENISPFSCFPSHNVAPKDTASPDPQHHPWTHAPVCTEILSGLGSKLCVYTHASFSNGRGISIFTTPSVAQEFAALPPFQDPSSLRDTNVYSGAWVTQELPGKGVGMLAKRQLNFKDRITAYTPALVALLEGELSTLEREKFYRIAVSQLPEATRESYLQLAFVYGQPSIRIQDIVKANTFQLQVAGQNHLAVFPETSRLNHACGPNAQYYLDPLLLTHFVHATRPISPGEEITISYTSPLESTEVRQQHLQEGFHFRCSCARCSNMETTDNTLRRIRNTEKILNDWSTASTASPELAEELLQLYREEGLEGFLDIPYGFAALAYNAIGNSKKAETYAELAKQTILLKDGPWTPNMDLWTGLLKSPKSHWSFKRRL